MSDVPLEAGDASDRRCEPRFLCTGEAQIVDSASGMDLGVGLLSDISPSGASLQVYCPLTAGTLIQLMQGDAVYHGEIRYCVPSGPDFRLGIQLIPSEQWHPGLPWPVLR